MNEKRIHSKTAIREAKSDAKKEERIGSVMDEINERLPLQESINAHWPPRVSSGATISSSPSSTLPGSRATYAPPDLKEVMQLASWVSMLSDIICTEPDTDSWYVAARRRATTLLQCKERQLHPTDSGVKSARHLFSTSHPTSVTSDGQWRKVGKTPFFHLPPADSNVKILKLTD